MIEILLIGLIVGVACYVMWRNIRRRMKSGCCGSCAKTSNCDGTTVPEVTCDDKEKT